MKLYIVYLEIIRAVYVFYVSSSILGVFDSIIDVYTEPEEHAEDIKNSLMELLVNLGYSVEVLPNVTQDMLSAWIDANPHELWDTEVLIGLAKEAENENTL